jgi:hypothetical protein
MNGFFLFLAGLALIFGLWIAYNEAFGVVMICNKSGTINTCYLKERLP